MTAPGRGRQFLALSLFVLFALQWVHATDKSDNLATGFQSPPDSAKPRLYWMWVSGNVSQEGITADLEAMKRVGIGGLLLFTVGHQSTIQGPAQFMSPEWRKLVHFALSEGKRLNLEISLSGIDGWSESGGTWIKPEQSMQQVVYAESQVTGGQKISLALSQPLTVQDYYEDLELLAFPSRAGDNLPPPVQVTGSSPGFDGASLIKRDFNTPARLTTKLPGPFWVQLDYAQPITCRSLNLQTDSRFTTVPATLQASDDGVNFKNSRPVRLCGCASFPPITSRHFRIAFKLAIAPEVPFYEIIFGGARIDQWDERVGMHAYPNQGIPFVNETLPPEEIVDPATIVDLTGKKEWDAPVGTWTLLRIGHTSTGATLHPTTIPALEVNKLSREDVTSYFNGMFQPIFHDSPDLIGTGLRGLEVDSWEAGCENWTPLIREEFQKRHGYDMWPWFPALTGRIIESFELTQRFLFDYRRTLADLLAENHYGLIQALAHKNHMVFYAEGTGIHNETTSDELQCKGRLDYPQGEFWIRPMTFDHDNDTKEAASASHIYGQNIAAAEAFTSTVDQAAWTKDPYSIKALGDREFCVGINRYVFHRYAAQPWLDRQPGMSMNAYGLNFERTNTWWEPGKAYVSYLTRCEYLLQQGRFAADLCYFYGEDVPVCLRSENLTPAVPTGYDYDVCNAEILLKQMSVENGEIVLKSGMHYRVLVLPNLDRMTVPVLQKVQALVQAGATVYGPKPTKSPSLIDYPNNDKTVQSIADEVWGNCDGTTVTEHACGQGKIVWGEPLEKALAVAPDFESSQPGMLYIHRLDGDADIYFVSNQQPNGCLASCTFRVSGKVPELWHPDTGKMETVALYTTADGRTTLPIHFDPVGSVFVIFRQPSAGKTTLVSVQKDGQKLFADSDPTPAEPPVSVDDQIELTAWQPGSYSATTADGKTLQAQVASLPPPLTLDGSWDISFPPKHEAPDKVTFDHLISWTDSPDAGVKYFSGTATYHKDISIPPDFVGAGHRVYLDLGEVKNLAQVSLNGQDLGILWKAPFRVEVTDVLKPGPNHLEIKITNLWPNRLIGDQIVPKKDRTTWASVSLYKATSPLMPSGLLGPVTLAPAAQVTLLPQ